MKRFMKCLTLVLLSLFMCGAGAVSAEAASNVPANVKALKVKNIKETTATLYWSKANKATGYYIYKLDASGVPKRVGSTKSRSYSLKKLKLGSTYKYQVRAYRKVKKKIYMSAAYSNVVTVKTRVTPPAVPRSLTAVPVNETTLKLSWVGNRESNGYEVASYANGVYTTVADNIVNPNKKKEPVVYKSISKLKTGQKYTYAVRSFKKVNGEKVYSKYTSLVSGKPSKVAAGVKEVRSFHYKGRVKSNVQVYNYDTKKKQTVKKGTIITSNTKNGTYLKAYLPNGDKIQIKRSAVTIPIGVEVNGKSDYSEAVKEAFVNSKGSMLASSTKYLVWISHYRTRVNVFKGSAGHWTFLKSFKVVVGRVGSVRGVRKIERKSLNGYEGQPVIYWSPQGNAFHSLQGGTPGQAISGGCIRMYKKDLIWMYNHIPVRTRVYSY